MPTDKKDEQPTALRRSSRSTRGSIKPIIDLTKPVVESEHDEEEDDEEEVEEVEEVEDTKPAKKRTGGRKSGPKAKQPVTKTSKKSSKTSEVTEMEPIDKSGLDDQEVEFHYQLSEKELKEVNNAFDLNCPSDSDEQLASDDLKTAIRSLGFEPRADEIKKLLKKFSNKAGKINRGNFQKIMALKIGSSPGTNDKSTNDEITKVFNLLDLDKSGVITLENLRAISDELNEKISEEELQEMIAEADLDGDNQINKEEFYNIMKKTSLY